MHRKRKKNFKKVDYKNQSIECNNGIIEYLSIYDLGETFPK
jgi:hypothetical protein